MGPPELLAQLVGEARRAVLRCLGEAGKRQAREHGEHPASAVAVHAAHRAADGDRRRRAAPGGGRVGERRLQQRHARRVHRILGPLGQVPEVHRLPVAGHELRPGPGDRPVGEVGVGVHAARRRQHQAGPWLDRVRRDRVARVPLGIDGGARPERSLGQPIDDRDLDPSLDQGLAALAQGEGDGRSIAVVVGLEPQLALAGLAGGERTEGRLGERDRRALGRDVEAQLAGALGGDHHHRQHQRARTVQARRRVQGDAGSGARRQGRARQAQPPGPTDGHREEPMRDARRRQRDVVALAADLHGDQGVRSEEGLGLHREGLRQAAPDVARGPLGGGPGVQEPDGLPVEHAAPERLHQPRFVHALGIDALGDHPGEGIDEIVAIAEATVGPGRGDRPTRDDHRRPGLARATERSQLHDPPPAVTDPGALLAEGRPPMPRVGVGSEGRVEVAPVDPGAPLGQGLDQPLAGDPAGHGVEGEAPIHRPQASDGQRLAAQIPGALRPELPRAIEERQHPFVEAPPSP